MKALIRIMDANFNRAREGLRVVEELARLLLEDKTLHRQIKTMRHGVVRAEQAFYRGKQAKQPTLIQARAVHRDPGAALTTAAEAKRTSLLDLARANSRRVQEALRVMEEISKLTDPGQSKGFKSLRFKAYRLESALIEGIEKHVKRKTTRKNQSFAKGIVQEGRNAS